MKKNLPKNLIKKTVLLLFIALIYLPIFGFSQVLTPSTSISITKTWPTKPSGYAYPIAISVPSGTVPPGGFPVCILLHGNGSQNLVSLAGPPMIGPGQFGAVLPCHILVAPTGFENSWNICSENSDAPDVDMINDLVNIIQTYTTNVNPNKIRILGVSNGSGLTNRVFIENTNPGIDMVCAIVSHLSDFNYRSGIFYKPNAATTSSVNVNCGYNVPVSPINSRKYLSISNTNDNLIPYLGGTSLVGATFLPAETAAFNIATYKGYTGGILTSGSTTGTGTLAITSYSYLGGDVTHVKGAAFHQANATEKAYITSYFSDCVSVVTSIEDNKLYNIEIYPNPASNMVNIKANSSFFGKDYIVNDNLGRTLLLGKIISENTSVDISNLAKGIYFLTIKENLKQVLKLVKE
jgi:poly(3-hydroxybutyrate) depolymerase